MACVHPTYYNIEIPGKHESVIPIEPIESDVSLQYKNGIPYFGCTVMAIHDQEVHMLSFR